MKIALYNDQNRIIKIVQGSETKLAIYLSKPHIVIADDFQLPPDAILVDGIIVQGQPVIDNSGPHPDEDTANKTNPLLQMTASQIDNWFDNNVLTAADLKNVVKQLCKLAARRPVSITRDQRR